jgi:hypothetical protein
MRHQPATREMSQVNGLIRGAAMRFGESMSLRSHTFLTCKDHRGWRLGWSRQEFKRRKWVFEKIICGGFQGQM